MVKKGLAKRALLISAGVFLGLAALALLAVLWRGSTKEIEAVANSFTPLDGWVETERNVIPPKFICLDGNCPEVSVSWTTKEKVTHENLQIFLSGVDGEVSSFDRCKEGTGEISGRCTFSGKKGGYQFRFITNNEKATIHLAIRKVGFVRE